MLLFAKYELKKLWQKSSNGRDGGGQREGVWQKGCLKFYNMIWIGNEQDKEALASFFLPSPVQFGFFELYRPSFLTFPESYKPYAAHLCHCCMLPLHSIVVNCTKMCICIQIYSKNVKYIVLYSYSIYIYRFVELNHCHIGIIFLILLVIRFLELFFVSALLTVCETIL